MGASATALDPEALPEILGRIEPMMAPPMPLHSRVKEWEVAARELGIVPMPHQILVATYLWAVGPTDLWLWPEFAEIMARQNGKTEILLPHILARLKLGRRVLHTAQDRALPRKTFIRLAEAIESKAKLRERLKSPIRYANGQELIEFKSGGTYELVAPRKAARGHGKDDLLLDEIREAKDFSLIAAIKPTITASANPQTVYLSNAGDAESVVLNDLRRRAERSSRLCYLEWAARPDRADDDLDGWAEANPALGRTIRLETLLDNYTSLPREVWSTEHLCRWVVSMQPRIVPANHFAMLQGELAKPMRPAMGVGMDADGTRAAAALAWRQSDGKIALREVAAVYGEPIDVDRLGPDLFRASLKLGVMEHGYDDLTDRALAAYLQGRFKRKRIRAVIGKEWANACELFVRLIQAGQLVWDECPNVAGDLGFAARKPVGEGAWIAVKANEERPIVALLAAIRAVWLAASRPTMSGRPTIR